MKAIRDYREKLKENYGDRFAIDTNATGYEPNGEDDVLYVHFGAPGLHQAAQDILRIFPPRVLVHVLQGRRNQMAGVLVCAGSLVSLELELVASRINN